MNVHLGKDHVNGNRRVCDKQYDCAGFTFKRSDGETIFFKKFTRPTRWDTFNGSCYKKHKS
jgi:hypothetical protein